MGKKGRRNRIKATTGASEEDIPLPPVPDLSVQRRALRQALAACPFEELRAIYDGFVPLWAMPSSGINLTPVSEQELEANPQLARAKMEEQLNGAIILSPLDAPQRRAITQKVNSLGGMQISCVSEHGCNSYAFTVGFTSVGGKELVMLDMHRSMFPTPTLVFPRLFEQYKEGHLIQDGETIVASDVVYIVRAPDPMKATIIKATKTLDATLLYGAGGYDILLLEAIAVRTAKQKQTKTVEDLPGFTRAEALMLGMGFEGLEIKGYKTIGPKAKLEACGWCLGVWDAADESTRLKKCLGCKKVYYCSKECQASDWQEHKSFCQLNKNELFDRRVSRAIEPFQGALKEFAEIDKSQFKKEMKAADKMTRKKKQSKS